MKRALIILLMLLALGAVAGRVRLQFAGSPTPEVDRYRLYVWTNDVADVSAPAAVLDLGTNLDWRLDWLTPGRYWLATTALASNAESAVSAVLPIIVPEAPTNGPLVAVESAVELTGPWLTNVFLRLTPIK